MMPVTTRVSSRIATMLAAAGLFAATAPALAAGSNMPWEQPLRTRPRCCSIRVGT